MNSHIRKSIPSPTPYRDLTPFKPGTRRLFNILPSLADRTVLERPEEGLYVVELHGSARVCQVFPESYRMIIRSRAWDPTFSNAEEAAAWVDGHIAARLEMEKDPAPRAGDLVLFPDGLEGVIDSDRYPGDLLQVCLHASTFREVRHVSCSGGPIPAVRPADLIFSGQLGVAQFWRWRDGTPRAHNGVTYAATVPIWNVVREEARIGQGT
jgi:hypothetical protein